MVPLLSGVKNYLLCCVKFKAWAANTGFVDLLVTTKIPVDEDAEEDTEEGKKKKAKAERSKSKIRSPGIG